MLANVGPAVAALIAGLLTLWGPFLIRFLSFILLTSYLPGAVLCKLLLRSDEDYIEQIAYGVTFSLILTSSLAVILNYGFGKPLDLITISVSLVTLVAIVNLIAILLKKRSLIEVKRFTWSSFSSRLLQYAFILGGGGLIFYWIFYSWDSFVFPPGCDPGFWLLKAYEYQNLAPSSIGMQPLFFALLATFHVFLRDPLLTLKFTGPFIYSLSLLPTFVVAKKITNNTYVASIASFLPLLFLRPLEMLVWGGYHNLMALLFVPMLFNLLLHKKGLDVRARAIADPKTVLLFVYVFAIVGTHHLTMVFVLVALFIALTLSVALNDQLKRMLLPPCVLISVFVAIFVFRESARVGFVGNVAAYYTTPSLAWLTNYFFRRIEYLILLFFSIIGFLFLFKYRKRTEAIVLLSWFVSPIILTYSGWLYRLGLWLPANFSRFLYFVWQPLTISMILVPLILYERLKNRLKIGLKLHVGVPDFKRFSALILIILFVLPGIWVLGDLAIDGVENLSDLSKSYHRYVGYGDKERLEAILWIRDNTPKNAVIVTDHWVGLWVKGLAHREVLGAYDGPHVFGAEGRYLAKVASSIMHSNYEIQNGIIRLRFSAPLSVHLKNENPTISINRRGVYFDVLGIQDDALVGAPIQNVEWINRNSTFASLRIQYEFPDHLLAEKIISVQRDSNTFRVHYQFAPLFGSNLHNVSIRLVPGHEIRGILSPGAIDFSSIDKSVGLQMNYEAEKCIEVKEREDSAWSLTFSTQRPTEPLSFDLEFSARTDLEVFEPQDMFAYSIDELIEKSNVSHILISADPPSRFPKWRVEKSAEDPRFRCVFNNTVNLVFEHDRSAQ